MTEKEAAKDVQIMRHNEGFSVVYDSRQKALRSDFESQQAAIDAVNDWNQVGDFQMKLAAEVLDVRYDVDEERAKMGLKPLAEERDGQYFVDEIMTLKALGSPNGKVLDDISKLDLDGSDAKEILRLANQGLSFVKPDDMFFDTLRAISDFGKDRSDFDGRAAKKMLGICQEGIDAQSVAAPSMR
ncbi:hypothetical protein [Rhizobium sp. MHM7A]|uniref:hypothetical protein n=1 Tax=Rhizobium sp. MHM7A TaxID=2583233 RepID=UPI001106AD4E|nr:hypothetical protein [Rhizobium sp. MHM7A]TLX16146.1 hypothetical protein FFR93_02135 [Rhizobium sp. MHM7A]